MSKLPEVERLLLGPGPTMTSARVMRAMAAPTVSHFDPLLFGLLDEIRERLGRLFRAEADKGHFALLVSGTGTSGMETTVANLVREGTRALVVVSGYFGDRLAQMCQRYGADVHRLDVEWGRACDPEALRRALASKGADVVAMVHAETSTGVLNPVKEMASVARERGALTIVDAVTSFGGQVLDVAGWELDAVYSCSQKCLAAPAGMSPVVFSSRALAKRVPCRSFYFDIQLLQDYWVARKYHHTISSVLVYALHEALAAVEEEGLEARWNRHHLHHLVLWRALEAMGLSLFPPDGERLWTLNAIRVPAGLDEAKVRKQLLEEFHIEIGAGLGQLAGKIFRVGLMGASSSSRLLLLFLGAFERVLAAQGVKVPAGAGTAAAVQALGTHIK